MDNGDVLDPRSRADGNQVTADRSYSEVTGGSVPQDVPLPAVVSNDDKVMKTTYAAVSYTHLTLPTKLEV